MKKEKIVCAECGSGEVIKRGLRSGKFEVLQKYLCNNCGRCFTLKKLEGKSYTAKIVMDAVSNYNLGYTLEKSSKLINKRFKVNVSVRVISDWLKEFKDVCSYHNIRDKAMLLCNPKKAVFSKVFVHQQPYKFQYHRAKLDMFLKNFRSLRFYIKNIAGRCPNKLFFEGIRSSQVRLDLDFSNVDRYSKFNYACKLAKLALTADDDNRKRHALLQWFMLVNDSCTIAAEVPVYLLPSDLRSLEDYVRIFGSDKAVTGHIDLVQVRYGRIYILDFKPNAGAEKVEDVFKELEVGK